MKPVRVLIVDRNPVVRGALAARLRTARGLEVVHTAAFLREALPRITAAPPQLVLLDSRSFENEPDLRQAADLVHTVRKLGPRIVVLATFADGGEREALLQAGVDRYLLKDIDSEALIASIAEVAAERSAAAQEE
jgi:DNA-binding NarL/FixJ family response regulator